MILRERIPVTNTEAHLPPLSQDLNPFQWISHESLEILCSLLLTRVQAESILRQIIESQDVEMLRIGALYRNLATHAGNDSKSGKLLYQELRPRVQAVLDSDLALSLSISILSAKWAHAKKEASLDMRIATLLLWELAAKKGSWFRHLEEVVASDIHSLAIRALGTKTVAPSSNSKSSDVKGRSL